MNGATNRLATATAPSYAASYQYDATGQIVSDGARNFTWSGAGNLSSVTSGQGTTSYLYNGMNQRVRKTTGAQSRYYVYAQDGMSVLGEYGQSAPGAPVGAVSEMVYLEGIPVAVMAGGQTYFVHADHLNTPRIVKNNAGAVVWRWDSDAFGNGLANSNPGGVMQFEFNMRFPGQVYDAESGLYYNNARYYDPVTGRYISSDPIGLAGGINTYGYVEGNPLSLVDPSGEWFMLAPIFMGAVTGASLDIAIQLAMNGGRFECINWVDVGVSSAGGAVGAGIGSLTLNRGLMEVVLNSKPVEWSHWIPGRYIKPESKYYKPFIDKIPGARAFIDGPFNGNMVTPWFHAMSDNARNLKGMTRADKWPKFIQQIARNPAWDYGSVVGSAAAVAATGGGCACEK